MMEYVKENDLKKEQIVSISCNETNVEEGQSLLILFFLTEQDSTMSSLGEINCHVIRNVDDWDD